MSLAAPTRSPVHYAELARKDIDSILALHLEATRAVGSPELVKPESREFFERILGGEGRAIGAIRDGSLIAYGILQIDLPPSEDARPLLGLAPADRLAKLAGVSVLPVAWGEGLHDAMIEHRIALAFDEGIDHLYATAAPGNTRSWANLIDRGFSVRGLIEKYGGHLRYLLYRDLSAAHDRTSDGIWCDAADIARQKLLIANSYSGTAWRRREDQGRDIYYERPA
jgi:ribosomal protein S18 acetylase RimI-like enzyme